MYLSRWERCRCNDLLCYRTCNWSICEQDCELWGIRSSEALLFLILHASFFQGLSGWECSPSEIHPLKRPFESRGKPFWSCYHGQKSSRFIGTLIFNQRSWDVVMNEGSSYDTFCHSLSSLTLKARLKVTIASMLYEGSVSTWDCLDGSI